MQCHRHSSYTCSISPTRAQLYSLQSIVEIVNWMLPQLATHPSTARCPRRQAADAAATQSLLRLLPWALTRRDSTESNDNGIRWLTLLDSTRLGTMTIGLVATYWVILLLHLDCCWDWRTVMHCWCHRSILWLEANYYNHAIRRDGQCINRVLRVHSSASLQPHSVDRPINK